MVNIPGFTPGYPNTICVAGLLVIESITIPIAFASSRLKPRRQRRQPLNTTIQPAPQPFYPVALPYLRRNANFSIFRLGCHTQEKRLSMKLPAETRIQIWQLIIKQSLLPSHPKRQPQHHGQQHGSNTPCPLNLLLACHGVYSEAIDLMTAPTRSPSQILGS